MNPIPASLMVAVLTVVGKWARNEDFDSDTATKNAVGVAGVALGLAFISEMDEGLGRAFGALVVVGVAFYHVGPIFDSVSRILK